MFDALSRLVDRPLTGSVEAGKHRVALSVDGYAPGLYVVRLSSGGEVRQRALAVVR